MKFEYQLTTKDIKKAAEIHYGTYRWTSFVPYIGAAFIIAGLLLIFKGNTNSQFIGLAAITMGFFQISLKKRLYSRKLTKILAHLCEEPISVSISDIIKVQCGNAVSKIPISSALRYKRNNGTFLIYSSRVQFLIFPENVFSSETELDDLEKALISKGLNTL